MKSISSSIYRTSHKGFTININYHVLGFYYIFIRGVEASYCGGKFPNATQALAWGKRLLS